MKTLYAILFMVFSVAVSGQDSKALQTTENNEIVGFKLYPNPVFDDIVYITTQKNAAKMVVIYDVFGKIILQDRLLNQELSIAHLSAGVYVLKVTEEKKTITRKLVVK